MRWPDYHCLDACVEPDHVGYDDDGMLCQLVTVIMTDDTMRQTLSCSGSCLDGPATWSRARCATERVKGARANQHSRLPIVGGRPDLMQSRPTGLQS